MIARLSSLILLCLWPVMPATAQDVLVLGEVHDNPAHHRLQADRVAAFAPAALVFEMLTRAQAARITPALRDDPAALAKALDWTDGGWPDFAMYYPIFAAAPDARIYGAQVPPAEARAAMEKGVATIFGPRAPDYGLTRPLPPAEQALREALQARAHCGALPDDVLPAMVQVQRLRDAALARAVVRARRETGGPVVVITGNGHARPDWGVPAVLARLAPELRVHSVGQGEGGRPPQGRFDEVVISAYVPDRPDPCAAFAG